MNLLRLKQSYQEQQVKIGINPSKIEQAARILSKEELKSIGDLWPEWATIFATTEQDSHPLNHLFQQEIHHSAFNKIKRFIDLFGSLIGLILMAVIFIPIAIAIKLDSPGPIFYFQTRCGLQGKPFRIWKFRTMVSGADLQKHLIANEIEGQIFKNQNDPRITRVGKYLRSTSLDEFPQFWNVFKGEMSLVGTRPPTPDEVKNYTSYHYQRLLVKPGITGEWQVRGRSSIKNFDEVVQMDLDYQQKWSLIYDLELILKTIKVVLNRQGAY